jgi:hypothetical protein
MYRPVSERSWGHEATKDLNVQPNRRQRRHNEAASKQLFDISARSPANSFRARDGKLPALHSHQRRYLQECDDKLRVPIPLAFNTGHDKNFEAAGRDLVDQELMAISSMLDDTNLLEVADLTFNSLLTDNGLVPFLQQLSRKPLVQTLQQLLLGSCLRAGARTLESLVRVIGRASNLRKLDLSHVPLPMRMQVPLCRAIRKSSSLETVNLMDTGLSLPHVTKHCIEELLSSSRVQNLDLSWNCFTSECFACLGEKLVDNSALKNLVLANCSATVEGLKDSPVCLFLECLARDKSLKKLDITMNRISSEAFLILEDGLERHPKLQELVVCNNPLGVYGIRSALRLLSLECNEIQKINLDGCFSGTISGPRTEDEIQFSASSPGGRYQIDFDRACHRSLLRMLQDRRQVRRRAGRRFQRPALHPRAGEERAEGLQPSGEGLEWLPRHAEIRHTLGVPEHAAVHRESH